MHPSVSFQGILESDPQLYLRLKPNATSAEKTVLGRRLVMDVDAFGCRPVIGQPSTADKTLAVYGCSCTYGHAIAADETFCSLLQEMLPAWRVENHGVPGYAGAQNLLQLERNSRWGPADYVTLCWIPHHLLRNIGDLSWMQKLMEGIEPGTPERIYSFPRAFLDRDGRLGFRSVNIPRWDLLGVDLADFRPDWYYLELVCFSLFERAAEIVKGNGGHFFVTTLLGHLSEQLRRRLDGARIPIVDAGLSGVEYTNMPDDHHPNAVANRIYASKIGHYLLQHSRK